MERIFSSVNQKQHADIQASINTVHVDLKSVLLDILAKFNQTAENLEHRPSFCSNILPHQNTDFQPRKQEQTESVSSPKSERRTRAPSGRPKCPQPRGKDYFALDEFAENPVRPVALSSSMSLADHSYSVSPISRMRLSEYEMGSRDTTGAKVAPAIPNSGNLGKGPIP